MPVIVNGRRVRNNGENTTSLTGQVCKRSITNKVKGKDIPVTGHGGP
jgi:hypothetical protein